MKKQKNLTKKIQRLKDRIAKDAKRLAKLTMKLGAVVTGGRSTRKRKSPTVVGKGTPKATKTAVRKPVAKKPAPSRAAAKKTSVAKPLATAPKAKKKLNLTPERRAQLAAAMKARWDAKRASASPTGANA